MLYDMRESLRVAYALNMDRPATSNFLLAHSSVFWDTRTVLRTQILRHAVPHYRELVLLLKPQPSIPSPAQFQTIANSRLERLRELCESHGAKLVILVPPTPSSVDAVRQMTMAAQTSRMDNLV